MTCLPSLARNRSEEEFMAELRTHCSDHLPCRRICATLLNHRLPLPWDGDDPETLLFPMVRAGRQFFGKCALRGIPRDIARQLWTLHRLCLGTFLPPSEMDDSDLHRSLCSFSYYRGHLLGKALAGLGGQHSPGSYLALLSAAAPGTEKEDDILAVMAFFDGLIADASIPNHATSIYVLLGGGE